MKLLICGLVLLGCVATGIAQRPSDDAKAPVNHISLETSIGSTATSDGRVVLSLHMYVGDGETSARLLITGQGGRRDQPSSMTIEKEELANFEQQLAEVMKAAEKKEALERSMKQITVKSEVSGSLVTVTVVGGRGGPMGEFFRFDMDNAPTFLKLVQRARQNADWMEPRVKFLEAGSASPVAGAAGQK